MKAAVKKYGREAFTIEVATTVSSHKELDFWESFCILCLDSTSNKGYNVLSASHGSHTAESIEKMSRTKKGKRFTAEHKAALSAAWKPKVMSVDGRARHLAARQRSAGNTVGAEGRANMRRSRLKYLETHPRPKLAPLYQFPKLSRSEISARNWLNRTEIENAEIRQKISDSHVVRKEKGKMNYTENLVDSIKQLEGFTPVAKHLSIDRPGVITYGHGDTDCKVGDCITLVEADLKLRARLTALLEKVKRIVEQPLNDAQCDAVMSFCYNVGVQAFKDSTLLKKINAKDYAGAAGEFSKWTHANGIVLPGLVLRRRMEEGWFERAA